MNNKTSRRALLLSIISLILCCAMLVGTTMAWFTDAVSSTNNQIKAGNLDVELYYQNDEKTDWTKVESTSNIFKKETLWEPGHTEVVKLKVVNEGTLALKYQLGINIVSETGSTNKAGDPFKVSDYIKFAVIDGEKKYTRAEAVAAAEAADAKAIKEGYSKPGELKGTELEKTVTVVVYMPENVDNAANHAKDAAQPTITLGLNVAATQVQHESDSFGNDYDGASEYLTKWDGEAGEVPAEVDGVITITAPEELAALAEAVNGGESYAGKTVKLGADLNLNNKSWTPIGACNSAAYFQGTFDGQNYTVYGLNVDKSADEYKFSTAGLFGWIDVGSATIQNVNISGATVKGSHWVGALVGYMTGDVINCSVSNSTVIGCNVNDDANGDKIGGLVGYMNTGDGSLVGNTVSNTSVTGYRDVAGLAGAVATTNSVKNNKVQNVTVVYSADYAAEIVTKKTAVVVDDTNTASNVTLIKGEEAAEGVIKTGENAYSVTSTTGLLNVNDIIHKASTGEGRGIKVTLLADIDLAGKTWKPIDKMWIEFDGNGHTISNLTANAWKAGFFGYLGGGSIKNLTLENVNVTGAQVGAFAGAAEGRIENCVLKGNNTITWTAKHQYDDPSASLETWGGIGAITGILQPSVVNATIAEGATVTLNYGTIETEAPYDNELTGYIGKNQGTVTNNGTVIVNKYKAVADGLMQNESTKVYSVSNANGLATLNAMMADKTAGRNAKVELTADIDFSGKTWTPVDSHADTAFSISELNGNGHTVSNMTINGQAMFKRFAGSGDVVIKDITFDNATVNSGALNTSILTAQSYQNVLLDNVDVKNSTITGSYKVAPLIATVYNESSSTVTATLKDCDVSDTTVKATSYDFCTTGMVAFVYADDNDKIVFENCTVSNVALTAPNDGYKAHAAIYTTGSESLFNEAEGVTVTNVTFAAF